MIQILLLKQRDFITKREKMEYIKNLLELDIKLHNHEIGRATNQGHLNKAIRLRDELRQLKIAIFRLKLSDEYTITPAQ